MRNQRSKFDEFVRCVEQVTGHSPQPSGHGWLMHCPAHDDRRRSLSVSEGDDGRVLVKCHAGCSALAVTKAVGKTLSALMPHRMPIGQRRRPAMRNPSPASDPQPCPDGSLCTSNRRVYKTHAHAWAAVTRNRPQPDQFWEYYDRAGELVGLVLRWNVAGGGKDIRPLARLSATHGGPGWIIGAMPPPRPLYGLRDLLAGPNALSRVYVVEGEKAADAGRRVGLLTVTSAGGASAAQQTDWSPLAGRDIVLLPDHDDPGRKYVQSVLSHLVRLTPLPTVRLVRLPALPEGGDLDDFVAQRPDISPEEVKGTIDALCEQVASVQPAAALDASAGSGDPRTTEVGAASRAASLNGGAASDADPSGELAETFKASSQVRLGSPDLLAQTPISPLEAAMNTNPSTPWSTPALQSIPVVTRLEDCRSTPIRWLWPGRLPAGKLTMLVGDPGLGKSFVTLDIAARVSRGRPLPQLSDESVVVDRTMPGSVILLSAEDDVSDTIRPRLAAAGADLSRITALQAVRYPDENTQARDESFSLASDLDVLERLITSLDNCRLIVIDPITAYLGAGDAHNNAEMRSLLAPLSDLAARTGVAVLAVNHLNKGGQGPAIYRSMGSLAFAATVRSVLAVLIDPYDPAARILVSLKSNLGVNVEGMRYRITTVSTADEAGVGTMLPVVEWGADCRADDGGRAAGRRRPNRRLRPEHQRSGGVVTVRSSRWAATGGRTQTPRQDRRAS